MRFAIIVARGGSKRIPRKNIRPFYGKPIIAYSIEAAKASGLFDRIYCSTEDDEIASVAEKYGSRLAQRPIALANDTVGTQEVMRYHATTKPCSTASYLCCIYPAAPLMLADDLRQGLQALKNYGAAYAFSVGTNPLCDAGAWYWGTQEAFATGVPIFSPDSLMVPIPDDRVCDINTPNDWERAERMYAAMSGIPAEGQCVADGPIKERWAA